MSKTYVIYGVSKGLGHAILKSIPHSDDIVFGISRSSPSCNFKNFHWISADLSQPEPARNLIQQQIQNKPVDYLIYNVGIWEDKAFESDYEFENCSDLEISNLIHINIQSCILAIQSLIKNLTLSILTKVEFPLLLLPKTTIFI